MPPTVSAKEPQVVPPEAQPGAGVGPSPSASKEDGVPNEDMMKGLQLLQGLMSAEDFPKYEKMVSPTKEDKEKNHKQLLMWYACVREFTVERGHDGWQGTKPLSASTLCKVRRRAVGEYRRQEVCMMRHGQVRTWKLVNQRMIGNRCVESVAGTVATNLW